MEKYVIIDLETTGHSPAVNDKIIEAGIVVIQNDHIVEDFSTLFNPNQSIPPFITNLTGIRDEDVSRAPVFSERASEIVSLFNDAYFVAHNVPFDLGFLNTELKNNGFDQLTPKVIDTVELSRILFPQAPGFKLNQLADFLDIQHEDPHRALSDAYVTAKLFLKLKEKLQSLPSETITHLLQLEKELHSDLYLLLHKYQELSHHDFHTYRGVAYKKIGNMNDQLSDVNLSFGDFLDHIFRTNGTMEKEMKNYEKRPGQRVMAEHIFDNFQAKKHALIEAGTGTGKSLAYLLPSIYEAVQTNNRIVISTYTTQLQTQLLDEEIPLVRNLIPFSFRVALLKGKSHYISLERFAYALSLEQEENYDITLTKAMILVWLTETNSGDIDEIQLPSSGYHFFKGISAESEAYIDPQSPWYSRSYYHHALMKAQQAHLVITNHALLCADIFNDYNLVPTYDKAIIDEAHHLENTVSKHYGLQLDYVSMQYALNQIGTTNDGNILNRLMNKYPLSKNKTEVNEWDHAFHEAKYELDNLFRYLFEYVVNRQKQHKTFSDVGRIQYRLTNEDNRQWTIIIDMARRVTSIFKSLIHILLQIDQYFDQTETSLMYDQEDLSEQIQVLQTFVNQIEQLFLENNSNLIKWIEIDVYGAKNSVYIYSEPLSVSTLLQEDFFSKKQSVILTSATLTMRNSFSFMKNRLGLKANEVFTAKIQSPFSYQDQVQLLIPNDFPHIDDDEFIYSTCEAILSLAEVTKGRMLVLFTSYEMLRKSHQILREIMDLDEYMLIAQGISSGSRARLKKNFQTFDKAILLGTSSFWEGVDIPGEDLSAIMIVRLPFQPPHHPVFAAKAEELKRAGQNAFFNLSLPNAVLRFKQGFGRLIRSVNDRGVVFVCDGRIIKSQYGKFFTESIPDVPIFFDTTHELIKKAEKWF